MSYQTFFRRYGPLLFVIPFVILVLVLFTTNNTEADIEALEIKELNEKMERIDVQQQQIIEQLCREDS